MTPQRTQGTKWHGPRYRTVCQLLRKGLSPEAIANRLVLEMGEKLISHERIYRWVHEDWRRGGVLHTNLVLAYKP